MSTPNVRISIKLCLRFWLETFHFCMSMMWLHRSELDMTEGRMMGDCVMALEMGLCGVESLVDWVVWRGMMQGMKRWCHRQMNTRAHTIGRSWRRGMIGMRSVEMRSRRSSML